MEKNKKKTLILDIEANAIDNPDKLWCVVTKDIETNEVKIFRQDVGDFRTSLRVHLHNYSVVVGHNITGYDWVVLSVLVGELPELHLLDTLILSRMYHYAIEGGHSLDAWGRRLGFKKQEFDSFHEFSEEMVDYCVNDVELTHKLYNLLTTKFAGKEEYWKAIEAEHKFQSICQQMHDRGFSFDYEKAKEIHEELRATLDCLEEDLTSSFKPKTKLVRHGVVKATKYGTVSKVGLAWHDSSDYSQFTPGAEYSLIEFCEFNPSSPTQIVERLNELGWNPTEKTKGHIEAERNRDREKLEKFKKTGWKVSEKNIATLPPDAPEAAQKLVEYILLTARVRTLETWFKAYREDTGAIHGTIVTIGSWPHRVAHKNPNMGNVPTKKSIKYNEGRHRDLALKYGESMRRLWRAREGHWQVGCDAAAIHLRILAHLCNDPVMIKGVTTGKQEDGTDIHTQNKLALGDMCRDRDQSKTFIYSFINGAGAGKVAEILNCSKDEGAQAIENFTNYYEGFREFKERQLPIDEKRGYIISLDGRPIIFPTARLIIPAYLLSGEQAIMKHANILWHDRLTEEGVPFWQLNMIHDEWQTEVEDDDKQEVAKYVGEVQSDSIRVIGEEFEMNCPLAGEYRIGNNWYETH